MIISHLNGMEDRRGSIRAIVQIIYIGICAVLIFIVLKQEGKSSGLSGALTGASESYWSKNRGVLLGLIVDRQRYWQHCLLYFQSYLI